MIALAEILQTKDLLETIAASVIAGLGVTIVFSVAVYGATRFADLSRDERPIAAAAAIGIALLAFAACMAGVVFGIIVMTSK